MNWLGNSCIDSPDDLNSVSWLGILYFGSFGGLNCIDY